MSRGYLAKCASGGKPKIVYTTEADAEGARSSMIGKGRWTAAGSNTYWCNQHNGWHAGQIKNANRGRGRTGKGGPTTFLATQ